MQYSNQTKKGFTLIELLLVVAIAVTLATIVGTVFTGVYAKKSLETTTDRIAREITEARDRTMLSEDNEVHGVHFSTSTMTHFTGSAYDANDPLNEDVSLSSQTTFGTISLNGGDSDLIFERVTGKTSNYGTVSIVLRKSTTTAKVISINELGVVTVE